jgi:hypothetical protein
MKALLPSLATTVLVCIAISTSHAQSVRWERLAGPAGGSVTSIASTPDGTLLAALDGQGLFRSDDGGSSWKIVGERPDVQWSAIINTTRAGTLLLSGADSLLRRSTDMGATWTVVSDRMIRQIPFVRDSSGGIIGAGEGGLYRSTDDGISWTSTGSAIPEWIGALAVGTDGRLVATVEDAENLRGVKVSTDMGATWRFAQLGDSNTALAGALTVADGRIFAGSSGGGLFRSDDGGTSWTLMPLVTPANYNTLLTLRDGSVIAGTLGDGVFRSVDGGASWQTFGADVGLQVATLRETDDGRVLAGTWYSGVYTVEPALWKHSSLGLPPLGTSSIAFGPSGTIHLIASDGRLYSSSNNGASWDDPGASPRSTRVIAVDRDERLYAGSFGYPNFGLVVSTNGGRSWEATGGLQGEQVLALLVDRRGHIYAGVERGGYSFHNSFTDGLFRSTDQGATWTTLGTGLRRVSPSSIVELGDGTLFIGASYGDRVYRLTPGDTVWQVVSSGLPPYKYPQLLHMLVADREENLYAAMKQGLFRSSDRGASWQNIGGSLGDTNVTALAVSPMGRIFAATARTGVFASDDNGTTWRSIGDPQDATELNVLAVDSSGAILAGGWAGLLRGVTTSSVPAAGARIEAGLAATPNPAGGQMTVQFDLPVAGQTRLALYSTPGEEIRVVAEGEKPEGRHRMEIDCSGIPAGRYLLRLETSAGSQQIGVVVVR